MPPEIRLQIYALVLGARKLCIGYAREEHVLDFKKPVWKRNNFNRKEGYHIGGSLYIIKDSGQKPESPDLRFLRVCREIYTETALLPYSLNTFIFQCQAVRKRFEKSARAGKKRAQKRAVGKYELMETADAWREESNSYVGCLSDLLRIHQDFDGITE